MEMYTEQGEDRRDCELKIASKYNRPFKVIREKKISIGGFLGLFSKPGIQVEFIFSPPLRNSLSDMYTAYSQGMQTHDHSLYDDLSEAKRRVIEAANGVRQNSSYSQQSFHGSIASEGAYNNGKETSQAILDTLNELKHSITGAKKDEHPAFIRAQELLKLNDFSERYIDGMLERMRKELSLEQLENSALVQERLLEWIGESISIYTESPTMEYSLRRPKIMVLVGPTGVGKTTTISKLAAIYGIGTEGTPAIDVRMITIDAFRICAKEQLEQIGNIMQIPVCCVVNKTDLRKELALRGDDTDLFLIDTIGKSPKDAAKLGEMKEILEGAGRGADFHLVISAGTKTADIEVIMQQFEPFDYKSVVFTKIDETDHFGNLISALAEKKKSVSFITDGQTVPVDIKRASVVHFLINLEGFKVDREKIEKRFPSGDAGQFKWR